MRRLFGISRRFRLEALSSVADFARGQRPAQVICTAATAAMGCPPATKSHRKSTHDQECLPYLQDSRWPRVSCGIASRSPNDTATTAATPAGIDTPRRQQRRPSVPTPMPLTQTATSSVSPTTSVLPAATTTTTLSSHHRLPRLSHRGNLKSPGTAATATTRATGGTSLTNGARGRMPPVVRAMLPHRQRRRMSRREWGRPCLHRNGPGYRADEYDLDREGNGVGCEQS
jgi:hypothetical protein